MKVPLVVDTNVVVAGLLSRRRGSPVCLLLDGMLAGAFPFVLSPRLLAEYREVLLRPAVRARHRSDDDEIDVILTEITANAMFRDEADHAPPAPDQGDDHLWRLLATKRGATLVTGDRQLLAAPPDFAAVVSPAAAVAEWHRRR